jgi:hypothetical protein
VSMGEYGLGPDLGRVNVTVNRLMSGDKVQTPEGIGFIVGSHPMRSLNSVVVGVFDGEFDMRFVAFPPEQLEGLSG